ncbi:MAG: S41 family peptidase [Planctomycetaceae bacterium]|nr:S41 family peptidase [Planctomycetaceae bacterium]
MFLSAIRKYLMRISTNCFMLVVFFASASDMLFAQQPLRFVTPLVGNNTVGEVQGNPLRSRPIVKPAVPLSPAKSLPADTADVVPHLYFTPSTNVLGTKVPPVVLTPISDTSNLPDEQTSLDAILREGARLEAERRWADVCKFYDEAIQIHRNNPALTERHANARRRYDVVCRYHDSSFVNLLLKASMTDNLVLFDEVTTKIQSDHIDAPHWSQLFSDGLRSLEIALSEQSFLKTNGIENRVELIVPFLQSVHNVADNWQIEKPDEMRNGVIYVAQMAERSIGISQVAVLLEFMCGVANSLDPYTAFLTKNQLNDQYSMIDGRYVGLGVELNSDRQTPFIGRVIAGSPAQEAGLVDGDRILSVNNTPTQGLDAHQTGDLLQGEINTVALLMVQTQGQQPRRVEIKRRPIEVPSVEDARMLNQTTGYFRLTCFQSTTTEEVRRTLWNLHNLGMQCLVIDLRHNPGGLFPVAVDVVNMFIDNGTIVSTRVHPQDNGTPYYATPNGTWTVPLVVLIDRNSASASEIFAGAIRDHKRGIVIGNRSYGKGTVQTVHSLHGAAVGTRIAGLKVTIQKYYSPSGLSCSGVGVVPDIEVSDLLPSIDTHIVARPIDGQIDIRAGPTSQQQTFQLPQVRRPSSSPADPCILQAVETAKQMLSTLAKPMTYQAR